MTQSLSLARYLKRAALPLGLLVLAGAAHAQVPAPPVPSSTPPATASATDPDYTAPLYYAGGDYDDGYGLFVDPAVIDRSVATNVRLQVITVLRNRGPLGTARYERAVLRLDCSDDNRQLLRKLARTQFQMTGPVAQTNLPGETREAIPGTAERKLWQIVCRGTAFPADDGNTVAGIAGAIALYDPLQDDYDDTLANQGVAAKAEDPGRALYVATRVQELAAPSEDALRALLPDYERAADQGSRQAMWRLADLGAPLKLSDGPTKWWQKLADAGDVRAQYFLALQLRDGSACPQSRTYLQQAAAQGYVLAEVSLGYDFENGICGPVDTAQAAVWYEKAARAGNFNGQLHLGNMYEQGISVTRSPSEAGAWYSIATGHSPWEKAVDQYQGELALDHLRQQNRGMMSGRVGAGLGDYDARARQLCLQDKVCSLVVVKDVGDLPRPPAMHSSFEEEKLAEDRYRVQYKDSISVGENVITQVAIMRGAQICQAAGYPYLTAHPEPIQTLVLTMTGGFVTTHIDDILTASADVQCSYARGARSAVAADFIKSALDAYGAATRPGQRP